jgi:hypothetical protein
MLHGQPDGAGIWDLIHRLYPDAHGRAAAAFLKLPVPAVARSSKQISVSSRATLADLTGDTQDGRPVRDAEARPHRNILALVAAFALIPPRAQTCAGPGRRVR